MAKSAQDKFNEYLDESRETRDAINEVERNSRDNYGDYAFACGVFSMMLARTIGELPKAKRAEFRNELYGIAQKQKNEMLMKTIKEAQ